MNVSQVARDLSLRRGLRVDWQKAFDMFKEECKDFGKALEYEAEMATTGICCALKLSLSSAQLSSAQLSVLPIQRPWDRRSNEFE